jgi:hypothetical protein
MKGTTLIYRASGAVDVLPWADRNPDLAFLQTAVGGYIEAVPLFTSILNLDGNVQWAVAYCNEKGKLNQLPVNVTATTLWQHAQYRDSPAGRARIRDHLCGDVVVVTGDDEFMHRHIEGPKEGEDA